MDSEWFRFRVIQSDSDWEWFRVIHSGSTVERLSSVCCVCVCFPPQGCDKENRPVRVWGLWVHQPPAALLWGNSMREEPEPAVLSTSPRLWAGHTASVLTIWIQLAREKELRKNTENLSSLRLVSSSHTLSDSSEVLLEEKNERKRELEKVLHWNSKPGSLQNHPNCLPPSHHPLWFSWFLCLHSSQTSFPRVPCYSPWFYWRT